MNACAVAAMVISATALAAADYVGDQLTSRLPPPVVEVQGGGGLEQRPHHPFIRIYGDGLVESNTGHRYLSARELRRFTLKLKAGGASELTQEAVDKARREPGEPIPPIRGGSGVLTLVVHGRMVTLNRPFDYRESKQPALKSFLTILNLATSTAGVKLQG